MGPRPKFRIANRPLFDCGGANHMVQELTSGPLTRGHAPTPSGSSAPRTPAKPSNERVSVPEAPWQHGHLSEEDQVPWDGLGSQPASLPPPHPGDGTHTALWWSGDTDSP